MLSGRTDSLDKVQALYAGAGVYVTKPFGMDESLARIRAVSRRAADHDDQPTAQLGHVTVDLSTRRVTARDGQGASDVRLTPTEWHLLEVLLRNPGRLMSQRQLLRDV